MDASAARLTRAIEALESRLQTLRESAPAAADSAETDALHAELRERRIRERALEGAAAEASSVLGRAAEQIRAALEEGDDSDEPPPVAADADENDASLDHLSDDQTDLHPTPSREF